MMRRLILSFSYFLFFGFSVASAQFTFEEFDPDTVVSETVNGTLGEYSLWVHEIQYVLEVPEGVDRLIFRLDAINAGVDMILRHDSPIEIQDGSLVFDHLSSTFQSSKYIDLAAPTSGTYYVGIVNAAFFNVSFMLSAYFETGGMEMTPTPTPSPTATPTSTPTPSFDRLKLDKVIRLGPKPGNAQLPSYLIYDDQTNRLYISSRFNQAVSVLDGGTLAVIASVTVDPYPGPIALHTSEERLYVLSESDGESGGGVLSVVDTDRNIVVKRTTKDSKGWFDLVLCEEYDRLFLIDSVEKSVDMFDTTTDELIGQMELPSLTRVGALDSPRQIPLPSMAFYDPYLFLTAVGGRDSAGALFVHNVSTGKTYSSEGGSTDEPYSVAVDPQNRRAYVSTIVGQRVLIFDMDRMGWLQNRPAISFESDGMDTRAVAVDSEADRLYVAGTYVSDSQIVGDRVDKQYSVRIKILSSSTLERIATVDLPGKVTEFSVQQLQPPIAIDPVSHVVLIPNRTNSTVAVLDPKGKILADLSVGVFPSDIAVDARNRRAFVAGLDSDNIATIDLDSLKVRHSTALGEFIGFPVVSDEYNLVAVGSSSSNRVALIDGNSGSVTTFLHPSGRPIDLEVDETLGRLYIGAESGSEEPGNLDVVSLLNFEKILSASLSGDPRALRVDPTQHRVYVTSRPTRNVDIVNGTVDVFDSIDGEIIAEVEVGRNPAAMALDSSNKRVYVGNGYDVTISILSTETLQITNPLPKQLIPITPSAGGLLTSMLLDSMATYPKVQTLFFSSPTDTLLDANGNSRYLVGVLDGVSGDFQDTVDLRGIPGFVLFDEDTDRVLVSTDFGEYGGAITVIDPNHNQVIGEIPVGSQPLQLSRDRNTGLVYVAVFGSSHVALVDPRDLRVLGVLPTERQVRGVAVNSNTHTSYATMGAEGAVAVISDMENPPDRPAPPERIITLPSNESVSLVWTAPAANVKGYNVYRAFNAVGPYGRVNSQPLPANELLFLDTGLINGEPVYYKVTSIVQHNIESDLNSVEPVQAIPRGGEQPDFSISTLTGDNRVPVVQGVPARISLLYQSLRGFVSPVTWSLDTGLPEGMSVDFSDKSITVDELESGGKKTIELTIRVSSAVSAASIPPLRILAADTESSKTKTLTLFVTVISSTLRDLTMGLSSQEIYYGEDMTVFGRVTPAEEGLTVQLLLGGDLAGEGRTDSFGHYSIVFQPEKPGQYVLNTRLSGGGSLATKSKALTVLRGKTRVVLTTDRRIDASSGPIPIGGGVTIQGQITPNPDISTVNLLIEKPSGKEIRIQGIVTTPDGYFGLSIPFADVFNPEERIALDEPGLYRCKAVYHGNLNFLPSQSEDLLIPVAIEPGDLGKAIIVTGGSLDASDDAYRVAMDYLSALAYQTLRNRRFLDSDIYLLTRNGERDIDGDGDNDADGISSLSGVRTAITGWAAQHPAEEPLVIYLVDHGVVRDIDGDGSVEEVFHCRGELGADPENDLTSEQLASFLGALPSEKPVTIIMECCHSGSFVDNISASGRVIITSTDANNLTYAEQDGAISFSQFLWDRIALSQDLRRAFYGARQDVRSLGPTFFRQNPLMDDDGDGIPNEASEDGPLAAGRQVGYSFNKGSGFGITNSMPVIQVVSSDRELSKPGTAEIYASVNDPDGVEDIDTVFATITPPDYVQDATAAVEQGFVTPILNLKRIALTDPDGDSVYRTLYDGFNKPGAYQVSLFARDRYGHTAVVREISVEIEENQSGKRPFANGEGAQKEARRRSFVTIGVQSSEEPTPTPTPPGTVPLFNMRFSETDEVGGLFLSAAPTGFDRTAEAKFGTFPGRTATDARCLQITAEPGEGILMILGDAVPVTDGPVVVSVSARADRLGSAIALAALNSPIDGQLAFTNPVSSEVPVEEERRFTVVYNPPSGAIQPGLQVALPEDANQPVTVWFDDLEVIPLDAVRTESVLLSPSGSFDNGTEGLLTNINGPEKGNTGLISATGDGALDLAIEAEDTAANIGVMTQALQDGFPLDLHASVEVKKQSGSGGVTALMLTNGLGSIGLFVHNDGLPAGGTVIETGGLIWTANPALPVIAVVQNGGPGVLSTLRIDNLYIEKRIE